MCLLLLINLLAIMYQALNLTFPKYSHFVDEKTDTKVICPSPHS